LLATLVHAEGPSLPEEDAPRGKSRAQAIEAYLVDCHANLTAVAWVFEEETVTDECLARDVYQSCNPDTFGCAAAHDACEVGCQPGCTSCQKTCGGACDGCKAACKPGDQACLRKCAEARADCRAGCLSARGTCEKDDCAKASSACMKAAVAQLHTCKPQVCDAYVKCTAQDTDDYEKVEAMCSPKLAEYSPFCENVCRMERYIPAPEAYLWEDTTPDTLAKACTAEAQCPSGYAEVVPYLASFCAGTTDEESFGTLEKAIARGAISKRALSLTYNMYGAMHGYVFKKENWMNGFFYGSGAWLPESCRVRVKSVTNAKSMPLSATKLRDRFKRLADRAK
jgi:hypothetical protein